ncbi:MAG: restriction endonuclease subunit S [Bacteroidales bacterium]|jgi:type I restriction enzyme S subunit|nr:restriction endonuclease subunit S [Bacteroidales bacterium]
MNKIEKLVQQLCPNDVEYKKLGEVVNILDNLRNPVSKSAREKGNIPYYGANGTQDYVKDYIFEGVFLLMGEDGSVMNKNNSPVLHWATGKIWVNNHAHIMSEIKNIALLRFIYFYLQTVDVTSIVRGMPPKINQQNLRGIYIPIPPLPIQQEIVTILDKFTSLEAELEAELEARKKQYEYYRDILFDFDKEINKVEIGKFAKLYAGATPKTSIADYWENGNIPWMSSGEVNNGKIYSTDKKITELGFKKSSTKLVPANTVVIALAGQGKTRGNVAITRIPLCTNQSLCSIVTNKKVNSNYLYYFLRSKYQELRHISSGDGNRGGLNLKMISNYKVPVPPLSEQERIVSILDKFDALVNDISIGLPAEIEARRKQYEYYRNQLLDFKPLSA